MAEYKPLVIKSEKPSLPSTDSSDWKEFTKELHSHAKNITTGTIGEKKSNLGAIVSGVPTVFARADLFKLAIDDQMLSTEGKGSLNEYYRTLIGEWKGLLSCIALQPQSLDIERIDLVASPGAAPDIPINIYEPKCAFGTMLFENRPKWCEVGDNIPYINVIKFGLGSDKIIVGATSPESMLFTSVSYRIKDAENCPFINSAKDADGGKFIDPLDDDVEKNHPKLTREQCGTLYAYVKNLVDKKIPEYLNNVTRNPNINVGPSINNVNTILKEWLKDIKNYALEIGWAEEDLKVASIPTVNCFKEEGNSFASFFNYSEDLWAHNGMIFTTQDGQRIRFDPKCLLLPKDTSDIAQFNFHGASKKPEIVDSLPIIVLPAKKEDDVSIYKYFSLPFTPLAIKVFGKNIGDLINRDRSGNTIIQSRIEASFTDDIKTQKTVLNVVLRLRLEGTPSQTKEIKEVYQLSGHNVIEGKNITLWPNFVSNKWKRYFMYTEIPTSYPDSKCSYFMKPFAWDTPVSGEMPIIEVDDPGKSPQDREPVYIDKDKVKENGLEARKHVVANNQSDDSNFKYEILESNKPFRGFSLINNIGHKHGGIVVIDYNCKRFDNKLQSEATSPELRDVNVGIDFGSTNTSVAYCFPSKNDDEAIGLDFKDRRVELLEQTSGNGRALPSNVFFFHRNTIKSNSLKSILAVHENRRLVVDDSDVVKYEIKGGFPCFENNVPISKVMENQQELLFANNVPATLFYNLKWSTYDLDISHVKAYLRTLMLYTYAELFDTNLQPIEVKWSYPSSMESTNVSKYQNIWSELNQVQPLTNGKPLIVDKGPLSAGNNDDNIFNGNNQNASSTWGEDKSGWGDSSPADNDIWGSPSDNGDNSWGNQSSNNSWDNPPSAQPAGGGWNPNEKNTFFNEPVDLSELDENIGFRNEDFEELPTTTSLTESEAVANFMAKKNLANEKLLLCFDVGGSTTDFSVLYKMGGRNTMLKQNSIRFAAQRVSAATKHSPNFKQVLTEMCQTGHFILDGLNNWNPSSEPEKSPYYFDKIVDLLPNDLLPEFYRKIHAHCPELFCVDLYVTGLIMFYAGQITRKLILDLKENKILRQPPKIEIHYAGKGARIFEWLYCLDPNQFTHYYVNKMFAKGIADTSLLGGQPYISMPLKPTDNKYEVSKGLALMFNPEYFGIPARHNNALLAHKNRHAIEIFGEDGFVLRNSSGEHPLNFLSSMTPERMKNLGGAISEETNSANRSPRFKDFCGIFYTLVNSAFVKLDQKRFMEAFDRMYVSDYIMKTKEYRDAENSGEFQYVAPIIIMEGMEFYDNYLFKLFNQ